VFRQSEHQAMTVRKEREKKGGKGSVSRGGREMTLEHWLFLWFQYI